MIMDFNAPEIMNLTGILPIRLSAMIIEDETMIGIFLSEFLEEMGYRVCAIASTQKDAVAAAAEHMPDLIIVDAKLQSGSGISAMQEILRERFVPHVFMSGYSSNELDLDPRSVFLHKPFSQIALEQAIVKAGSVVI